ncbi:MAG: pseudouridine-5'-phosphate glycosidase [Coprobacillus sp.]|nr:pseudouridine-5'-phosphate glycosidase [Coprobacillus sp.]
MLIINQKVKDALENHVPVVALESTIISHGMPYPQNVKTALEVEKIIESEGAVAATIGIIDGNPTIGMTPDQIEEFGKRKGISKVSKRDIAVVCARREWGATTVSATMILANLVGIKVFATGGIGGVHRGATTTFDISRDLEELGSTPVNVVCAGPKAILDLNLTMEYLETKGVTVIGYNTDYLPAFYIRESDLKVDVNCKTPREIAELIKTKDDLKLNSGVLITNPIAKEDALDKEETEKIIEQAITEADSQGIKGKDITPFLLKRISELTNGESLESNIKLVYSNAKLAAQIAKELTNLE